MIFDTKTAAFLLTRSINVSDIYSTVKIPAGYEAIAFRIPESGETILHSTEERPFFIGNAFNWSKTEPRLILHPLPKRKVLTYTEVPTPGDWVKAGQYYQYNNHATVFLANSTFQSNRPLKVYELVITEV